MDELAGFLADSVVCRGFDGAEVAEIAKICRTVTFQAGEIIVSQDTRGRDLYFIKSGRALINLSGPSARDDVGAISKCFPGQVFGELGFIDGARRSTWVVAMEDMELIEMSWEDFAHLIETNAKIGYKFVYNLAQVIAERLRDTTMSLSNILGMRGRC